MRKSVVGVGLLSVLTAGQAQANLTVVNAPLATGPLPAVCVKVNTATGAGEGLWVGNGAVYSTIDYGLTWQKSNTAPPIGNVISVGFDGAFAVAGGKSLSPGANAYYDGSRFSATSALYVLPFVQSDVYGVTGVSFDPTGTSFLFVVGQTVTSELWKQTNPSPSPAWQAIPGSLPSASGGALSVVNGSSVYLGGPGGPGASIYLYNGANIVALGIALTGKPVSIQMFPASSSGLALTALGHLYATADGWATAAEISPGSLPTTNTYTGMAAPNPNFGLIMGTGNAAFQIEPPQVSAATLRIRPLTVVGFPAGSFTNVSCADANHCFIASNVTPGAGIYYENLAPTTVYSVTGATVVPTGPDTWQLGEGEPITIGIVNPANNEPGEPYLVTWLDAGNVFGINGLTMTDLSPHSFPQVLTPSNLCLNTSFVVQHTITDGRLSSTHTGTIVVKDTVHAPPSPPALSLQTAGFTLAGSPTVGYQVTAPSSQAVGLLASSTQVCSHALSFAWASVAPAPAPVWSAATSAQATLPAGNGCAQLEQYSVTVTDAVSNMTAGTAVALQRLADPPAVVGFQTASAAVVSGIAPGPWAVVAPSGTPLTLTAGVSPVCVTQQYAWRSTNGGPLGVSNRLDTSVFAPDGCGHSFDYEFTVSDSNTWPSGGPVSATGLVTVNLDRVTSLSDPVLTSSPAMQELMPGSYSVTLAPGDSLSAAVSVVDPCNATKWTATPTPPPNGVLISVDTSAGPTISVSVPSNYCGSSTDWSTTLSATSQGLSKKVDISIHVDAAQMRMRPAEPLVQDFQECGIDDSLTTNLLAAATPDCPDTSVQWEVPPEFPGTTSPDPSSRYSLLVTVPSGKYGEVVGRSYTFRAIASRPGSPSSEPANVVLEYPVGKIVDLALQGDRPSLAPGEAVLVQARMQNRLRCAIPGIELMLDLNGIDLLPGSARYDGSLIEAERAEDGRTAFKGLPMRAKGEAPGMLSFIARRSLLGPIHSSSRATAYLPNGKAISEVAELREDASRREPAAGCGCETTPAGSLLWGLLGVIALRRRSGEDHSRLGRRGAARLQDTEQP